MPLVHVNGTSIHYHVHGSGIPIIFIHPPLLTRANFTYQSVQLADEFKVITFDIRGHGHSGNSQQPITYPLIVEDMKQLLDYLEIKKAYVCGYSTGGSIALEAMLTYPDRFLGGILISAMSEASDLWNRSRLAMAVSAATLKAKNTIALSISWGNADSTTTFTNLYKDAKLGSIAHWRQYYRYSLLYNCTAKLNRIHAPVLLIYGGKDTSFHRYAKLLHQGLPNNELRFIKNMKHQIPTKAAAQLNGLVRKWIHLHQEEIESVPEQNLRSEAIMNEMTAHEQTANARLEH